MSVSSVKGAEIPGMENTFNKERSPDSFVCPLENAHWRKCTFDAEGSVANLFLSPSQQAQLSLLDTNLTLSDCTIVENFLNDVH